MSQTLSAAPAGMRERYTPDELRILAFVAEDRGWERAEKVAERILAEARAIGDL